MKVGSSETTRKAPYNNIIFLYNKNNKFKDEDIVHPLLKNNE
jgi:hypothetical protein